MKQAISSFFAAWILSQQVNKNVSRRRKQVPIMIIDALIIPSYLLKTSLKL